MAGSCPPAAAAGKYVGVNNDDSDRDGAADVGDGFNRSGGATTATAGERFTPVFVSLNKPFDITRSTVRFTYRGDDPLAPASAGSYI